MSYGVEPTGFSRKPLPVILAEIQAAHVTEFGPDVVQTAQSPLGQINGLMADFIGQLWELVEDVYQSYDPDQAEGTRLDTLGKLRLLQRNRNETEVEFRQAITNKGQARVDVQDIVRALRGIDGVTYAQVFLNDTQDSDDNFVLPAGHICAAVIGGDDDEIALALRRYVVPGISTYGNTYISTLVDGFCRNMTILRPSLVPITMVVDIKVRNDATGCPPPSLVTIKGAMLAALEADFINGNDVTHFRIRSAIERQFTNVEVVGINASRDELALGGFVTMGFTELATFHPDDIMIVQV